MKIRILIYFSVALASTLYSDTKYYHNGNSYNIKPIINNTRAANNEKTQKYEVNVDGSKKIIKIIKQIMVKSINLDIEFISKKYNIEYEKSIRDFHVFNTSTHDQAIEVCQSINETENIDFAQPVFVKTLTRHSEVETLMNEPTKVSLDRYSNEDITSPIILTNYVNYYKYYDEVFAYQQDYYWHIFNNGSWTAPIVQEDATILTVQAVDDMDMNILEAWERGYSGKNVKVAVIDSGFDKFSPDLHFYDSWNTLHNNKDVGVLINDSYSYHGTAVAGVAVAEGNNDYGVRGIAYNADFIAISGVFEAEYSQLSTEYIDSMYAADDLGAEVLICSFGSTADLDQAVVSAINDVAVNGRNGKGMIIVFSSGNNGLNETSPEIDIDTVIGVGAIELNGKRAKYSQYTYSVDLVAPSRFLMLDEAGAPGASNQNSLVMSGTSFAGPAVAGVAALVLEANPALTRTEVFDILFSSTKKIGIGALKDSSYSYSYDLDLVNDGYNDRFSKNEEVGFGLLDADLALTAAEATIIPNNNECVIPENKILVDKLSETTLNNLPRNRWSLISNPSLITDLSLFNTENGVEIIWYRLEDATAWRAYSNNPLYTQDVIDDGLTTTEIPAGVGLWVYTSN